MSKTLYVSNLPISATEDELVRKFTRFGTVLSVRLNRDPASGRSQRSGFVEMKTANDAQTAIDGLNLASYDGRLMSVNKAIANTTAPP